MTFLNKKTGLRIAVIGQDGAGKTTLTKNLYIFFKENHRKVFLYYLGYGNGYNSFLKNIVKRGYNTRTCEIPSQNFRDLALMFFYLEVSLRCVIKIKIAEILYRMGYIVIFDRFPQIQINGIYDGPKILSRIKNKSFFLNMLRFIFSKIENKLFNISIKNHPDIVVKLMLPVHVSKQRKPDHCIDNIKIKNEITRALQFEDSIIIDIDASRGSGDVFNDVCEKIEGYINH